MIVDCGLRSVNWRRLFVLAFVSLLLLTAVSAYQDSVLRPLLDTVLYCREHCLAFQ